MPDLDLILRERFGFDGFRPGQREAIEALLGGQDLLVVQPTGHGKSLLYQLPAAILPGPTLVISPLLALMRDQLDHLAEYGIAAASLNSDQTMEENDQARQRAAAGEVKILFVAPEQLDHVERAGFLVGLNPSLVVIDEAHCISTWGHDFRPAYREIANLVHRVRATTEVRVLALTATADARTEADIAGQLAPIEVQRRSMDRVNLSLEVVAANDFGTKLELLDAIVAQLEGCGLVYCATRDNTEVAAAWLKEKGHRAAAYHAGLPPEQKRELQRAFVNGDFEAIAATNALGMGIDKSDLRYVVHLDVPGSITAYYQEVGRAGRDGQPARGVLLYDPDDRRIQEYFIHSARPTAEDFARVLEVVRSEPGRLTDIKRRSGLHPTRVTVILAELVEQGHLAKEAVGRSQQYVATGRTEPPDLSRYANQHQARTAGLDAMVAYASGEPGCLMQTLRQALGDEEATECGRCSACVGSGVEAGASTGSAAAWMADQPTVIAGNRSGLGAGRAVYDSQRRSPAFVAFMRARTEGAHLTDDARQRLIAAAESLAPVAAVLPLPSVSWAQRDEAADLVAEALGVPRLDALEWRTRPNHRQGQLLNNDQRRANVKDCMQARGTLPSGKLLLLDDYLGSGATMNEAVRALVKGRKHRGGCVPLTLARVRWRLGRPGIV